MHGCSLWPDLLIPPLLSPLSCPPSLVPLLSPSLVPLSCPPFFCSPLLLPQAYEALPVEEFGKALLRGLGWDESQGIGRKRQLVEAKQGVRRPERLGLGAAPAAPVPAETKRPRKMGEWGWCMCVSLAPQVCAQVSARYGSSPYPAPSP